MYMGFDISCFHYFELLNGKLYSKGVSDEGSRSMGASSFVMLLGCHCSHSQPRDCFVAHRSSQ